MLAEELLHLIISFQHHMIEQLCKHFAQTKESYPNQEIIHICIKPDAPYVGMSGDFKCPSPKYGASGLEFNIKCL